MANNKNILVVYRLCFALLGFSAIVTEIAVLIEQGKFNPTNFFSYFTIEGNIIAVAVLLISAFATTRSKQRSFALAMVRGAATFYMVTVGIVFALLLSGIENAEFTTVPWDNVVLHYIMPIAVLLDWLIDPPKVRVPYKRALLWLLLPVAYVVYSLVRGAITDWYPYPFLDPAIKGYGWVAGTVMALLLSSTVIAWLLARWLNKPRLP